jgi:hypothetical protein
VANRPVNPRSSYLARSANTVVRRHLAAYAADHRARKNISLRPPVSANGVQFERYAEPVGTDEQGVHDSGYGKVAWFKDPDGNTFALES